MITFKTALIACVAGLVLGAIFMALVAFLPTDNASDRVVWLACGAYTLFVFLVGLCLLRIETPQARMYRILKKEKRLEEYTHF